MAWTHAGAFESLPELVRYHANPSEGIKRYDFSFGHLTQFADEENPYPDAEALTRRTLSHLSDLLPGRTPDEKETAQLVAFIESLTDPCLLNSSCIQSFHITPADNVDGHMMSLLLEAPAPPGERDTIEKSAPLPPIDPPPPVSLDALMARTDCENHTPARSGASESRFAERASALGVNHAHHMTAEMYYSPAYGYSIENTMIPAPMAVHDLDADCWPDLVFAGHDGEKAVIHKYFNEGGKGFRHELQAVPATMDAIGIVGTADLDADYEPELLVGNAFGARDMLIMDRNEPGPYAVIQSVSMSKATFGFAFGDYDGDGWSDVFASHWDVTPRPSFAPSLMQNRGGRVHAADREAGTTGAHLEQKFHLTPGFVDIDSDGDQDLLIASDFSTSEVVINTGGRFSVATDHSVITDENGTGAAIADFDNDGLMDWFATSIHSDNQLLQWGKSGNRLYRGADTTARFSDGTDDAGVRDGSWGWGACAADFNNDGWLDIFHENGFGYLPAHASATIPPQLMFGFGEVLKEFIDVRPRLFINRGDGTFDEVAEKWGIAPSLNGRGVACVDYDRDGDIDLVTSQNAAPARVLENRYAGSNSNSFVGLTLIGEQPNTAALGAIVKITTDGVTQMRQVELNGNFQSQDPGTLHFGLAGHTGTVDLEIMWPGGQRETVRALAVNRYHRVLQPGLRARADASVLTATSR